MTLTISIPPEVEARLKEAAADRGLSETDYAQQVITRSVATGAQSQSLHELFAEWEAEDATDDPEAIAQQIRDAEQFMQNLARNRLEMEGANARKLWP